MIFLKTLLSVNLVAGSVFPLTWFLKGFSLLPNIRQQVTQVKAITPAIVQPVTHLCLAKYNVKVSDLREPKTKTEKSALRVCITVSTCPQLPLWTRGIVPAPLGHAFRQGVFHQAVQSSSLPTGLGIILCVTAWDPQSLLLHHILLHPQTIKPCQKDKHHYLYLCLFVLLNQNHP